MVRRTLPNGVRLNVAANAASEAVVLAGLFVGGAVHDPAGKEGLASLTASVAQRATASRTYDQIYDELDTLGASISLGASTHTVGFHARSLDRHWPAVATVLADVLRHPSFPDDEFQRARGQALTGLREADDSTRHVASRELARLVYPKGHPYRTLSCGTYASVATLARDDLAACHQRLVRPDGLILSLVGNVQPDEALERLADLFGDWAAPAAMLPALDFAAAHPPEAQRTHAEMPEKSQADVALGFKAIPRRHPDYYALAQVTQIVGGMGLMGRLGDSVRDRQGLAYYAYATMDETLGDGLWSVRAGVNPANVERAVGSILDELRRIQDEPVDAAELADCQSHLVGVLPLRLETNQGVAATLNHIEFHGLGHDYIDRYPALIRSVTLDGIQRAAQAHLATDHHSLAIAGPQTPA